MPLLPILRPPFQPCARCGRMQKTWVIEFEKYEARVCGTCLMEAVSQPPKEEEKPQP
jgi:hypothetical protein